MAGFLVLLTCNYSFVFNLGITCTFILKNKSYLRNKDEKNLPTYVGKYCAPAHRRRVFRCSAMDSFFVQEYSLPCPTLIRHIPSVVLLKKLLQSF